MNIIEWKENKKKSVKYINTFKFVEKGGINAHVGTMLSKHATLVFGYLLDIQLYLCFKVGKEVVCNDYAQM